MSKKYLDLDGLEEVVEQINAKYAQLTDIPTTPSEVGALPATTKYGAGVTASVNSSTYVCTFQLKDQDGNNIGNPATIDLPIESAIVNASYDNTTKDLTFTLQNGNTVTVPLDALISGLQEQLVSGTNIKTINGQSILGSGDLVTSTVKPLSTSAYLWTLNSGVYYGSLNLMMYHSTASLGSNEPALLFVNGSTHTYLAITSTTIYYGLANSNSSTATKTTATIENMPDTAITTSEIEALF